MIKIEKNGCEYAVSEGMLQRFLDKGWHVVNVVEEKPKTARKPVKAKEKE